MLFLHKCFYITARACLDLPVTFQQFTYQALTDKTGCTDYANRSFIHDADLLILINRRQHDKAQSHRNASLPRWPPARSAQQGNDAKKICGKSAAFPCVCARQRKKDEHGCRLPDDAIPEHPAQTGFSSFSAEIAYTSPDLHNVKNSLRPSYRPHQSPAGAPASRRQRLLQPQWADPE